MHVIIDGYGGDPDQLADENVVRVILDQVPEMMGMTKITQPYVLRYTGSKPEDWGVSGFVMIAESHISMHTFPERKLVWADVFSCKDFDAQPVIDEIKKRFSLRDMDIQSIPRNLEPFSSPPREETAAAV
ncbi:MAG TPA: S-adenosylmethionine decarboxylase [Dehalococcoidia bacterium]|jgi:S-adenosylmethionine decarboxylase|nr:S-adenosylmethionine decarboxylase [Dehalococcoidia bacterium]